MSGDDAASAATVACIDAKQRSHHGGLVATTARRRL
jgi:hypothetical protein